MLNDQSIRIFRNINLNPIQSECVRYIDFLRAECMWMITNILLLYTNVIYRKIYQLICVSQLILETSRNGNLLYELKKV